MYPLGAPIFNQNFTEENVFFVSSITFRPILGQTNSHTHKQTNTDVWSYLYRFILK